MPGREVVYVSKIVLSSRPDPGIGWHHPANSRSTPRVESLRGIHVPASSRSAVSMYLRGARTPHPRLIDTIRKLAGGEAADEIVGILGVIDQKRPTP